jgi:hypothetical protein
MRALLAGETPPGPDPSDPMSAVPIGLNLASSTDPDVFRAMGRIAHLLGADPMEIVADPHVFAKAVEAFEQRDTYPAMPAGPTRDELLAAMARQSPRPGSRAAAG